MDVVTILTKLHTKPEEHALYTWLIQIIDQLTDRKLALYLDQFIVSVIDPEERRTSTQIRQDNSQPVLLC
jgi:hypothetical protein